MMRTLSGDIVIPYRETLVVEGNLVIYGKMSVVRTQQRTPMVIGCCTDYPSNAIHSRGLIITGDLYVCGDLYASGTISYGEVPEYIMGLPDVDPIDINDALEYE